MQTEDDGSPLTKKGRATRERIVDAASALIFEHGVGGTSLDDVGAAAGVGKSQLYHYFDDKSALVRAVIARQTDQILEAQQPYLSAMDTWEAWRAWRDLIVDLQRRRHCRGGCPLGSLASELSDTDELARVALVSGFDRWEGAFRSGLASMKHQGKLRPEANTEGLALATLASLQGGLLLCQTRKDVAPLEVALDAAIANILSWASTPVVAEKLPC
jgi:TetR/AcrR family transcriptional regulator, transcriptional repressor for nem operon